MNQETRGKKLVIAATGASGARMTARFVTHLLQRSDVLELHFIASDGFKLVALKEEGCGFETLCEGLPDHPGLRIYDERALDACVSSGSFPVDGTVIIPASLATVGAIASGAGRNLCHRVAEVALKEGRPLLVVPRETPLSLIHLQNLTRLREAGAVIAPFIPAFYQKPATIEDLMDHFFMRLFDHMGLPSTLSARWS
jgi:4-hydroxy-3-polyprenylbenzoate decarboxylase